ncbi:hypothetical protein ACIBQ2_03595 [Micromonospora sediminimaris]|uniref:Uncharacterized protein n=1 Tax=Micromonospora sediminimaris TaxID=547162 RepID=A0A9W5UTC1_9ACTN|nr:hypothetical protein [Micromonospora sediminimaris]GIJ34179.1 hypothetical protein Vse01_33270 [Micromonospora sediminimaris]SFD58324.1 hypothetical protein SAMN05216284_11987 [Micromonospora sediminimaris]
MRRGLAVLVVALLLSTPVVTAWLVGDLTGEAARRLAAEGESLDYAVEPVSLGATGDRVLVVVASALLLASLALLIGATVTRKLDPRVWSALVPLLVAGVLIGLAWRIVTAGAIGANIGAGLVVLGGGPVLLILLGVAAVQAARLRREHRRRVG